MSDRSKKYEMISDGQYEILKKKDPKTHRRWLDFQNLGKNIRKKEKMIEGLKQKLKDEQFNLKEMGKKSTIEYDELSYLVRDYRFSISGTHTSNSYGVKYIVLLVNKLWWRTNNPKKIFLGLPTEVLNHMIVYYKDKPLLKTWLRKLLGKDDQTEVLMGVKRFISLNKDKRIKQYITNEILKDPKKFGDETYRINDIFPTKDCMCVMCQKTSKKK